MQMMAPKFKEMTGFTFEVFSKKETTKKEDPKKETNTEKQQ
jgi:hypothetical protein